MSKPILICLMQDTVDKEQDHRIRISRRPGGNTEVEFHGDGTNRTQITLVNAGVPGCIRILFSLLRRDAMPYKAVQIDFPGFPPVVFKQQSLDLNGVIESVLEAVRMVQDHWWADEPAPAHLEDDDETDSTSISSEETDTDDDDDEYADMPPLIDTRLPVRRSMANGYVTTYFG